MNTCRDGGEDITGRAGCTDITASAGVGRRPVRRLTAFSLFLLIPASSCIFEPVEGPDYPSVYKDSFYADSLGSPASCSFSQDGYWWACACEGGLILASVSGGETVRETRSPLTDVAFMPGSGTAVAAAGDSLFAAGEGCPDTWIAAGGEIMFVEPCGSDIIAVCSDGSLIRVLPDLSFGETVQTGMNPALCALAFPGGDCIYLGGQSGVSRVYPLTGATAASIETPGPVVDLFDAGDGNVGIAAEGSNELWVLDPLGLSIVTLITFPDFPTVGAGTLDGRFYYGGCRTASGLFVVSVSGEQVLASPGYGDLADVALSPDGLLALVASRSEYSLTLLGF